MTMASTAFPARLLRGAALTLAGLALTVFLALPVMAQTLFLQDIDDVPLAGGLSEDRTAALVFDKPAGRIVEAEAAGAVAEEAVRDFYAATLPQLGWEAIGADRFRRGEETLSLSYSRSGGGLIVHYTLQPE